MLKTRLISCCLPQELLDIIAVSPRGYHTLASSQDIGVDPPSDMIKSSSRASGISTTLIYTISETTHILYQKFGACSFFLL